MSFSQDVKIEISQNNLKDCCQKAQLAALIKYNGSLLIQDQKLKLLISNESAAISRRIWSLIKNVSDGEIELSVLKKMNLKKNNIYNLTIISKVKELLESCGLWQEGALADQVDSKIVSKECCARAYIAGSFLAAGSVNSPLTSKYHLEVRNTDERQALFLIKLLERFNIEGKIVLRRKRYVVYLKASEMISDFLRSIGAHNAVMLFEDQRIQRDFTNNFIRLDNCEVANEVKTIMAAQKHIAMIEKIQKAGRYEMLEERLQEVANLRLAHPEASINELCEIYNLETGNTISKSGMNHRLIKLRQISEQL